MINDFPINSTKKNKETNNTEIFSRALFINIPSNTSNPDSNSYSPDSDISLSDQNDKIKNLLPLDLITSLNINEDDYTDDNKNDNNNDFLRNTICQFPKTKKDSIKEDEFITNDNTITNYDSRFSLSRNSNKTENNIQGYQNINQMMFDSPINQYMKRNNSSMISMPNDGIMPSTYYSPSSNIIVKNINNNLITYKLNNQDITGNVNLYFKNNQIINKNENNNNNRKLSFTQDSEYFSSLYDNSNLCPPSFLHYSAGFDKNSTDMNINNNINEISSKIKKNKKKKKHKEEDDEYITEMFGRRGWICEDCNNFNYETRNKCNRCKVPKKPLKIKTFIDNNGEKKLIDNAININHKDDWSCPNCNNINYAFRLVCNRCQMSKEDLIQAGLFEKID